MPQPASLRCLLLSLALPTMGDQGCGVPSRVRTERSPARAERMVWKGAPEEARKQGGQRGFPLTEASTVRGLPGPAGGMSPPSASTGSASVTDTLRKCCQSGEGFGGSLWGLRDGDRCKGRREEESSVLFWGLKGTECRAVLETELL